jgi:hypothetical protein
MLHETGFGRSSGTLGEASPAEARAALRSHARFGEAVWTATTRLVETYQAHRVMNRVFNDRGSAVVGLLALYLHFCGGPPGLTLSRMQALCAETAVCSRGRAAAMIALMRFARYLTPAATAADRRIRSLVPTERLIAAHRARWEAQLEALALVAPEGKEALARLDQKEFRAAFLRHQFAAFRAGFRVAHHVPALARYFESSSALMMLCSLLPPGGKNLAPVVCSVSISDLSRRFFVSRAHVRNLLRLAENDGFIERRADGPERITVLPRLVQVLAAFVGVSLAFVQQCARAALDDVTDGTPRPVVLPDAPQPRPPVTKEDGSVGGFACIACFPVPSCAHLVMPPRSEAEFFPTLPTRIATRAPR